MTAASLRGNKKAVPRPIGRGMRAALDGPQGFLQGGGGPKLAAASLRENKKTVPRPIGRGMRAAMDGPQGFLQGDGASKPHPLLVPE